jgi:hypothetical protein
MAGHRKVGTTTAVATQGRSGGEFGSQLKLQLNEIASDKMARRKRGRRAA